MGENEARRQAHRQKRGLLRVEEILQATGQLFAEVGYDSTTTNMIAARSGISPGSLYQFFTNKEAITLAYATYVTKELHQVYDHLFSSEVIRLPLEAFVNVLIEKIVVFNLNHPGYFALELGSTISAPLGRLLADLHRDIFARLDGLFAARWPQSTREQRRLPMLVSYRLFIALLPLVLQGDEPSQQEIVSEMKVIMYRYWQPLLSSPIPPV